ncbi:hypothetical protein Tco_0790347 [Tanacetum coccineum]
MPTKTELTLEQSQQGVSNDALIMAALAIVISSDSSDESVGSLPSWVILFGAIPAVIPSIPVTASEIFATAPVAPVVETTIVAPPTGLRDLIQEAIPFGQPYRTHLNGPRKLLTTRKRVGPILARRLAWRRVSPHALDHRSSSSSSIFDSITIVVIGFGMHQNQAPFWISTIDVSPKFGDSSERPLHSSLHSAGPSRKRCRSLADSVPSSTPVMGSLAPTQTKDDMELSISDGDDVGDRVEIDPRDVKDDVEEYEAETSAGDTVVLGIDPMSASIVKEDIVEPAEEDSSDSSRTRDGIVRSFEGMPIDLDDVVRDFYHHMSKVRIDRIVRIETVQRQFEANQVIASREKARIVKRIGSLRLENLKVHSMLGIERERVDSLRLHMSRSQEEFCQIRKDHDEAKRRFRRLESFIKRRLGFRP